MSDQPQMPDLSGLLAQAQDMMAKSAEVAETEVEGSAGGGMVKVVMNGQLEFSSVTIDPSVVDPADVTMLQDLILAALRDAAGQVGEAQEGAMGGLDIGSMMGGLGGLDGLLGGGGEE